MIEEYKDKVMENKKLTNQVNHIILENKNKLNFIPGQYISITIPGEKKIRKPYSIANPKNNQIELCIKNVGIGSNYLCNLKKDDNVEFIGPLGRFILNEESKDKDITFICAGTGISTFMSMIPSILEINLKNQITLIRGFQTEYKSLFDKEIKTWTTKNQNFKDIKVFSNPKTQKEKKGYVQDQLIDINPNKHYYICGLNNMIQEVKNKLIKNKVPIENIFTEKYD